MYFAGKAISLWLVPYIRKWIISFYNELKKKVKKIFFDKTQNHDVDYFTKTEKYHSENGLKIINFIQTWPSDVKKLKTDCRTRTPNY